MALMLLFVIAMFILIAITTHKEIKKEKSKKMTETVVRLNYEAHIREMQECTDKLLKQITSISEESASSHKEKQTDTYVVDIHKRDYPESFVAIDFETATHSRMACQLGVVEVVDMKITNEKSFLIQPPGNIYDSSCVRVHGITPEITENAKTFGELWSEIKQLLGGKVIIAHNASFDRDVLSKNMEEYGHSNIGVKKWICTCKEFGGANLYSACKYFEIPLEGHHDALNDARAAALLYIKYMTLKGKSFLIPKLKEPNKRYLSGEVKKQDLEHCLNCDTIFYNKKVVITGVFDNYPIREELAKLLKDYGADINASISRKTEIIIVGCNPGPAKLQKIADINNSGGNIRIIEEAELLEILSDIKCGE